MPTSVTPACTRRSSRIIKRPQHLEDGSTDVTEIAPKIPTLPAKSLRHNLIGDGQPVTPKTNAANSTPSESKIYKLYEIM